MREQGRGNDGMREEWRGNDGTRRRGKVMMG